MRKPDFAYAETKVQLSTFVFATSLYVLNPKPTSVAVQPGLCQTWSETPKTGFLASRIIFKMIYLRKQC